MDNIKLDIYDGFCCIADRCEFTCCAGWDISIDEDTCKNWRDMEQQSRYFSSNIKTQKNKREKVYYIKMGQQKRCPFLNEKELCNVVIHYGDDKLPFTCRTYPRQVNLFSDHQEFSLSCGCPSVVDLIYHNPRNVQLVHEKYINAEDIKENETFMRQAMILLIKERSLSFKDRILLIFHMLFSMKEQQGNPKDIIYKYQDEEYVVSLIRLWSGIKINYEDTATEKSELFLDIVQNYRNEISYSRYLTDIVDIAEKLDENESKKAWDEFQTEFNRYDMLMENCIITKIFANCISEDMDELIMSYQMIITELVMVKYSVFLTSKIRPFHYSDVRDYVALYSRIIGYNTEGMIEFWEESFEEPLWQFGYMLLLIS
ncbi:MAG: FliB family protein [Herbinix sp.]|nr:FliB family protein [Herbinix sp.]